MSWILPVALLLFCAAVVLMALWSEHRRLVAARALVHGPPPTRGDLLRAPGGEPREIERGRDILGDLVLLWRGLFFALPL